MSVVESIWKVYLILIEKAPNRGVYSQLSDFSLCKDPSGLPCKLSIKQNVPAFIKEKVLSRGFPPRLSTSKLAVPARSHIPAMLLDRRRPAQTKYIKIWILGLVWNDRMNLSSLLTFELYFWVLTFDF